MVVGYLAILFLTLATAVAFSYDAGVLLGGVALIAVQLLRGKPKSVLVIAVGMLLLWFIKPEIGDGREAARRSGCLTKVRQIQLAIYDYSRAHGHLPPPFTVDEAGRPMHSWRVLILPYLGDPELQTLYDKIDLTKPWSDPKNRAVGNQMPSIYRCPAFVPRYPGDEHTTAYVAVVGDETLWSPSQLVKLTDKKIDLSGKLSIIESERFRQHWMSTGDPSIAVLDSSAVGSLIKPGPHRGGVSACAFADVHVKAIRDDLPVENLRRMLTISVRKPGQQATTQSADSGR